MLSEQQKILGFCGFLLILAAAVLHFYFVPQLQKTLSGNVINMEISTRMAEEEAGDIKTLADADIEFPKQQKQLLVSQVSRTSFFVLGVLLILISILIHKKSVTTADEDSWEDDW